MSNAPLSTAACQPVSSKQGGLGPCNQDTRHEWCLLSPDHETLNNDEYICVGCGVRRRMPSPYLPPMKDG